MPLGRIILRYVLPWLLALVGHHTADSAFFIIYLLLPDSLLHSPIFTRTLFQILLLVETKLGWSLSTLGFHDSRDAGSEEEQGSGWSQAEGRACITKQGVLYLQDFLTSALLTFENGFLLLF